MRNYIICIFLVMTIISISAQADEFYVHNRLGRDAYEGTAREPGEKNSGPFRTIHRALKEAGAGDTIHLVPTDQPYRQTANFYGHTGGEKNNPLVLNGHGVTLKGSDPVPAEGWKRWKDGVYTRGDIRPRGFMLVEGEMVFATRNFNVLKPGEICHMPAWGGRLYLYPPRGEKASDCKVRVGMPDGSEKNLEPERWHHSHSKIGAVRRYPLRKRPEWVELNGEKVELVLARDRLDPGAWSVHRGAVYYRPPEGKKLKELQIEFVVRGNGVQITGKTSHVVVKNINATKVYNDGYNIHGAAKDCRFYNCNAHDCGDEGFSAHDRCETFLDGAVYRNCSNGIANVNTHGSSITRNVTILESRAVGYLIQAHGNAPGTVHHELENAVFIDNPTQINGSNITVRNVLIIKSPKSGKRGFRPIAAGRSLLVRNSTITSGTIRVGKGKLRIEDSLVRSGFHVRADEPLDHLSLENVMFVGSAQMEWGSRYPWKRRPLKEWLALAKKNGAAKGCRVGDQSVLPEAIESRVLPEKLPEGGCDAHVWKRYYDMRPEN
ncbi:MAG: right-handed parallel beta-helix repeat-containing protein [Candidatus Brocadiia bacterium]